MIKRLSNIVGVGNVSENPLDLEAYSYCSSEEVQKPSLVVWPQSLDQIRRVVLFANQSRMPMIIRGAGTSKSDGSIAPNTAIISLERMNKIKNLDLKNKFVEVEAGVKIKDLNNALAEFKMFFPFEPFNPVKTIGGLLSLNTSTKESQQLGAVADWVEEAEFVDGTAKHYTSRKKEVVLGNEGVAGIITKAKLRITEFPVLSIDVFSFTELSELLKKVRVFKNNVELYFLEFVDQKTAEEIGFDKNPLLIAGYTTLKGKNKGVIEVRKILEKINSIHSNLRTQGFFHLQDPAVSLEKSYDLIKWCDEKKVRLTGRIGLGLFYAYFMKEDDDLVKTFRIFVRRINGVLGKGFGYGEVNKDFVNPVKKKELVKLKDEYDYNNILNPDKVISYR